MNAAVWFGAAVFFTFLVWPLLASGYFKSIVADERMTFVWLETLDRFFLLSSYCGAIALFHQAVEWLYTGKAVKRVMLSVTVTLFLLSLFGYYVLEPKMQRHHFAQVTVDVAPDAAKASAKAFGILRGMTHASTFALLGGIGFYLWRLSAPQPGPRFNAARFNG